jgi:hypothetical protein
MATSDSITSSVPTQAEFLEHRFKTCPPNTPGLKDSACSICVEDFKNTDIEAVKLIPCEKCYFHKECIVEWLKSIHERHSTCPNDRAVLFQSTPVPRVQTRFLTQEEVHRYIVDRLRRGTIEEAVNRYETFVRIQEEALHSDEIIDAWATAEEHHSLVNLEFDVQWLRAGLQYLSAEVSEHSQRVADEIDADLARLYARFRDTTTAWIRERETAMLTRIHNMKATSEFASEAAVMKSQQFYEGELQKIVHKIIDPTRKLQGSTFKDHAKDVASLEDYLATAEQIILGLDTEVTEGPVEEDEVLDEETKAMLAQAEDSRSRCANN